MTKEYQRTDGEACDNVLRIIHDVIITSADMYSYIVSEQVTHSMH